MKVGLKKCSENVGKVNIVIWIMVKCILYQSRRHELSFDTKPESGVMLNR